MTVPADASGVASFQYQSGDGRCGTATAKFTLTVKDRATNEAPAQKRIATLLLAQGKSIRRNVSPAGRTPTAKGSLSPKANAAHAAGIAGQDLVVSP